MINDPDIIEYRASCQGMMLTLNGYRIIASLAEDSIENIPDYPEPPNRKCKLCGHTLSRWNRGSECFCH